MTTHPLLTNLLYCDAVCCAVDSTTFSTQISYLMEKYQRIDTHPRAYFSRKYNVKCVKFDQAKESRNFIESDGDKYSICTTGIIRLVVA